MAKRRAAEPLALHVPCKRLLLCGFPEEPPPLWTPPSGAARPRKRRIDAGAMAEPAASPSKRRGTADGEEPESRGRDPGGTPPPPLPPPPAQPRGPGEEPRDARPLTGGAHDGAQGPPPGAWGSAARQYNEEFWQYNTFQYWRNPLPPIDLADIQGVSEDSLTETTLQDKNGVAEIDMES
uniref:uncharacterized protein C9orf40 homolog n=1 Tax=Jaculus jaculus TaxID=51337 RepID=UPI001E1B308F|nr:uncharacterized protein C9orf40 homolog [Jaculus jaculus]